MLLAEEAAELQREKKRAKKKAKKHFQKHLEKVCLPISLSPYNPNETSHLLFSLQLKAELKKKMVAKVKAAKMPRKK